MYQGQRSCTVATRYSTCLYGVSLGIQIFALSSDDQNVVDVIARVNSPFGGGFEPPLLSVKTEFCLWSLKWLKKNTSIPFPHVFAFDANPESDVGGAYMIQERILGQPFSEGSRMEIIQQLVASRLNLYKNPEKSEFFVGRSAPNVRIERRKIDRGPWNTPREEMKVLMEEQLAEIRTEPEKILQARQRNRIDTENFRIGDFEKLYAAILQVVEKVQLLDQSVGSYSILHPDLNLHNIIVGYDEPSRIIGIIDWEGARIQTKWKYCGPDFLWNPREAPCCARSETNITWRDVSVEWGGILRKMGPRDAFSDVWRNLAQLGAFYAVDYVTEWRSNWPLLDDAAFKELDEVLQSLKNTTREILDTTKDVRTEDLVDAASELPDDRQNKRSTHAANE
ncbi:hypothetical protein BD410DRAFT_829986 [Rickenella mellea]|uniref:Aminoglycoside phosphotransferase domain-containing protein n=1 Tax=Rickenella mellea TaxID=50990 RepID=A0A4Y7PWV2_9AGAM|nr:hypothetical protein BD410DRAFT_829986 [Rickenella mellea]